MGRKHVKLLNGNGIHVIFEEQGIDTRNTGVIFQLNLAHAVAESESESISENMKWTYRQKKTQGKFYGRKGMYYGYDTKDDEFKANADAENVRYIFESYANGLGMKEIADELNTRGIKNKKEREWTRGTVKYILKNEVYVGDVIFNKTPSRNVISGEIDKDWEARYVKDHHAGIISRELWDAVQKRMAERRKRNTKGIALFSPSSEGR